MHGDETTRKARLQEHAHSHSMRVKILALVVQDGARSLDPDDLRRELPGGPPAAVVRYHVAVLRLAGLLPSR